MTGKNLAQDSIGRYASHRQALREIRRLGFKGAEDMCDAYLGERYSTPLFAKFGDVVLINNPTGEPQLGICMGSYVLTTTEDVGLTVAGMDLWGSAWAN